MSINRELLGALKDMRAQYPAFRSKRIGMDGIPARFLQETQIALEDIVDGVIARAEAQLKAEENTPHFGQLYIRTGHEVVETDGVRITTHKGSEFILVKGLDQDEDDAAIEVAEITGLIRRLQALVNTGSMAVPNFTLHSKERK